MAHMAACEANATPARPSSVSTRREKPQLSCNACRKRKQRCDRQYPCSNCSSRGLASLCIYPATSTNATTTTTTTAATAATAAASAAHSPLNRLAGHRTGILRIQDRINALEAIIIDLVGGNESSARRHRSRTNDVASENVSRRYSTDKRSNSQLKVPSGSTSTPSTWASVPPSPSDHGNIKMHQSGVSYSGSTHWSAILDSIAELKGLLSQEDEAPLPDILSDASLTQPSLGPNMPVLLYGNAIFEPLTSIIQALPSRSIVDRLVSRYFNVLEITPGIVHSAQFLRQYEAFWKHPEDTPILWIGLLFSILCLAAQVPQAFMDPSRAMPFSGGGLASPSWSPLQVATHQAEVDLYRDKTTQCLKIGQYTKGGPYVLETLILYFAGENFHSRSIDTSMWLLVGSMVQIAFHMGYHRDARPFPNISPFMGEIRRRVWAVILQLDWSVSTQLGLPRLIRGTHIDTAEPRNLYDSDFDEDTTVSDMPVSRPETEVTPTLYVLAKLRLLSIGSRIIDQAAIDEPSHLRSYKEILELDAQIEAARDVVPPIYRWTGLSASLNVSPTMIIQRMWCEIGLQEMKIVVHRKFLEASAAASRQSSADDNGGEQQQQQLLYSQSRAACLEAAYKILEFQCMVDAETQIDGLLYQDRWRISAAVINDFLLATSILCFICLETRQSSKSVEDRNNGNDKSKLEGHVYSMESVTELLKLSLTIWCKQVNIAGARKAIAAIQFVLGHVNISRHPRVFGENEAFRSTPDNTSPYFAGFADLMPDYGIFNSGLEHSNLKSSWESFPLDKGDDTMDRVVPGNELEYEGF